MNYLRKHSKVIGTPPQTQPLDKDQVQNSAGGFSYTLDLWKQLERFLILGTEGGSYYVREGKMTFENVESLRKCLQADGLRTVDTIVNISDTGRAVKNEPALFALAFAISEGDLATRRAAGMSLPKVARTGTHLYHFVQFALDLRGWGRVLKDAVQAWYVGKRPEHLLEQVLKYRQRDGWSHRDLLRLVHPKFGNVESRAVAHWVVKGEHTCDREICPTQNAPKKLFGHIELQGCTDAKKAARLIRDNRLTWESVPTELLNSVLVWEALLEDMPVTAMIRNLGKMTAIEALKPLSNASKWVGSRLRDEALLKKGRVHPVTVLNALRTYQQGHGEKGKLSWKAVNSVCEALEDAFYLSFQTIEPTGKNFYFGLDVSGSMSSPCPGLAISCREGTAVMSMVSVRKEPNTYVRGFTTGLVDLPLTAKTSLKEAASIVYRQDFGGTDCAQPMLDATKRKLDVDEFVVMTDSETWAGDVHPKQALDEYRQKMGKDAKLVVVGMLANEFSIADPKDSGMLDVVGFDTVTPQLISQFAL